MIMLTHASQLPIWSDVCSSHGSCVSADTFVLYDVLFSYIYKFSLIEQL